MDYIDNLAAVRASGLTVINFRFPYSADDFCNSRVTCQLLPKYSAPWNYVVKPVLPRPCTRWLRVLGSACELPDLYLGPETR